MSSGRISVTALIAEDEAPQRRALVAMLAELWPELEIVAACEDGIEAMEAALIHRPSIAFLDIRMPGVSGLDVARALSASGTLVIFTTAYDEYAIRAFEAGAIDYLLKPTAPDRLQLSIARLRERLEKPTSIEQDKKIIALEANLRPVGNQKIRWISASIGDSVHVIAIEDVLFFQAQEKYVRVVSREQEAVIRTPLKELITSLDGEEFWQVQRGVIVRVAAIDRLRRDLLGKFRLSLKGHSETLPVSSAFLHRFRSM